MNKILFPTINVIKRNLFAPSDDLVAQWVERPETLTAETRQDLETSDLAQQEKQGYLEGKEFVQTEKMAFESTPDALAKVPAHIRELINRQCNAAKHTFSALPNAGLIVLINEAIGPEGYLPLDMGTPMTVILHKPTEHKLVWTGWVISSETDYASCWDMVLDSEKDAPLDPLVGMVQVWNSVKIYLPSIEKTIGELSTERFALVKTLANEYQYSQTDIEDRIPSEPGVINLRWIDDKQVLTGTPLSDKSDKDDPRWYYQELYFAAANVIREPALLAIIREEETETASSIADQPLPETTASPTTATINTAMKRLPNSLVFVPRVKQAMGENHKKDLIWQEIFRITPKPQEEDGEIVLHFFIQLKKDIELEHPVTFEYSEDGVLHHHHLFSNDARTTDFICDPETDYELRVMDDAHSNEESVLSNVDFEWIPKA